MTLCPPATLAFVGTWEEESKLALANPVSASGPCGCDVCLPYSPEGQSISMLSDGQQLA